VIQIQEIKSRIGSQVRRKEASPRKCPARRFVCRWGLQFTLGLIPLFQAGERSSGVDQSITQSKAALSLSDFWLSDHTRNYVSTYRIFAPAR